jgi:hypothetical protein
MMGVLVGFNDVISMSGSESARTPGTGLKAAPPDVMAVLVGLADFQSVFIIVGCLLLEGICLGGDFE